MPTHLAFLTLLLTRPLESLKCFWCTEFNDASGGFVEDQTACPSLRSDPSQWAKNSVKFYDIDGEGATEIVCGVGYSRTTGRVYYQVGFCSEFRASEELVSNSVLV